MVEITLESTPRLLEYLFRGKASKITTSKSKGSPNYFIPTGLGEGQTKDYKENPM